MAEVMLLLLAPERTAVCSAVALGPDSHGTVARTPPAWPPAPGRALSTEPWAVVSLGLIRAWWVLPHSGQEGPFHRAFLRALPYF